MTEETARLTNFKSAFKGMTAASQDAYVKTERKNAKTRSRAYDRKEIDSIVEGGDPVRQAELSKHYFETNGTYKRIVLHYATFLTYSWVLVPHIKSPRDKISNKKISQAYYNASDFCTSFQSFNIHCNLFFAFKNRYKTCQKTC